MRKINERMNTLFNDMYDRLVEVLKENNGFIDTQCHGGGDTIYAIDAIADGIEEEEVLAVSLVEDEVFVYLTSRGAEIEDWDEHASDDFDSFADYKCDGYWTSLRYSDVYFVHTLINICEVIDEYISIEK